MAKKSKAQKRAEAEIRLFQEGRGPFVLACETSRLPMVFTDAGDRENRIVYANESMLKLTGNTLEELLGKSFYSLIADETDAATIKEMKEAFEKGAPVDCEAKCQRKGARSFWASVYVTPVFDVGGRRVQYFASFIEHRYEEAHSKLIIAELTHRVKNTLATAQAIITQALGTNADRSTIRKMIESRLSALSRSHDLLAREDWRTAGLLEIINNTLEPFNVIDQREDRIVVIGENLQFPPKETLALCLVFHELATNALKYGALSNGDGSVHIDWKLVPSAQGLRLRLRWREVGGPPVKPPSHQGFGSRVISRGLAYELNGTGTFDYPPEGLVCEMDIPAPLQPGAEA